MYVDEHGYVIQGKEYLSSEDNSLGEVSYGWACLQRLILDDDKCGKYIWPYKVYVGFSPFITSPGCIYNEK
jgi:hypothetical protein